MILNPDLAIKYRCGYSGSHTNPTFPEKHTPSPTIFLLCVLIRYAETDNLSGEHFISSGHSGRRKGVERCVNFFSELCFLSYR